MLLYILASIGVIAIGVVLFVFIGSYFYERALERDQNERRAQFLDRIEKISREVSSSPFDDLRGALEAAAKRRIAAAKRKARQVGQRSRGRVG